MTVTPDASHTARYSSVAILLHWLLALMLAFQLALGAAMPGDESGFAAYQLHKSVGITILVLTLARLGWRLMHRPPPQLEHGLAGFLAKAVHVGFYTLLILIPLSGWALVSTAHVAVPTVLFGVIPLPDLPLPSGVHETSEIAHELLSWACVGLIALHVVGALRHHFMLRDGLLERMAPKGSVALVQGLFVLALALAASTWLIVRQPSQPPSSAVQQAEPLAPPPAPAAVAEEQSEVNASQPPATVEDKPVEADQPATAPLPEAPPQWAIQPGGHLGFSVDNGGDTISGSFAKWSGSISFDPAKPASADIRIDVNLASASVGDETMDGILRGAEFLAAQSSATATWRATSVRKTGQGRYLAEGTLSLKGARKPQSLTFTLAGTGLRRHVSGSATIDRSAFAVGTGSTAENIANQVKLDFSFDAVGRVEP